MTIKVGGGAALRRNIARLTADLANGVSERVLIAAALIQTAAIRRIQRGPKTGRVYARKGGKTHTASAPGQPPASDTGALASSVAIEKRSKGVRVGTGLEYGPHLEFGTRRMAARPWLQPSLEEVRPRFPDLLKDAVVQTAKQHDKKGSKA